MALAKVTILLVLVLAAALCLQWALPSSAESGLLDKVTVALDSVNVGGGNKGPWQQTGYSKGGAYPDGS